MAYLGQSKVTNRSARRRVEDAINAEANDLRVAQENHQGFVSLFLSKLPQIEICLTLWNFLADVRNDLDHAGMRESPRSPRDLVEQIIQIVNTINSLPLREKCG